MVIGQALIVVSGIAIAVEVLPSLANAALDLCASFSIGSIHIQKA